MVKNPEVAGDNLAVKDRPRGNINARALIRHNNYSSLESDIAAKVHISSDGEVIELEDVGDALEAGEVVTDGGELSAELDEGHRGELPVRVHHEGAMLELEEVGLHKEEVGGALDWQESRPGDVDSNGVLEVLDSGSDSGLELDGLLAGLGDGLGVDNDLEGELLGLDDALDGLEVDPEIVGVEDLELGDGLEVIHVVGGHLGDLEEADIALVVNQGSSLDVSAGLISDLHDELSVGLIHVRKDREIHSGPKVIHVGDEKVLLALVNQRIEEPRAIEGLVEISVAGGEPIVLGVFVVGGEGEHRVLAEAGEAALVKGEDVEVVVRVLLDDALGVAVGVERVHQDQGHVGVVDLVQVLEKIREIKEERQDWLNRLFVWIFSLISNSLRS